MPVVGNKRILTPICMNDCIKIIEMHPKSISLSLDRINRLLKNLDNPEKKITNAIQVIGTNGKYSVCSTLREIFETAGYKVNLNISPSLRKFSERYYRTRC